MICFKWRSRSKSKKEWGINDRVRDARKRWVEGVDMGGELEKISCVSRSEKGAKVEHDEAGAEALRKERGESSGG